MGSDCRHRRGLEHLWSGIGLIRQSIGGLMDVADPQVHRQIVELLIANPRTASLITICGIGIWATLLG